MVVDYIGAIRLVREMKEELEEKLGTELIYAAAAIPPGTDALDGGAIKNVVQGAGFEITALLDEPTAANQILKIKNGAVVDIGGGTTGISILRDGKVVNVDDEATRWNAFFPGSGRGVQTSFFRGGDLQEKSEKSQGDSSGLKAGH